MTNLKRILDQDQVWVLHAAQLASNLPPILPVGLAFLGNVIKKTSIALTTSEISSSMLPALADS